MLEFGLIRNAIYAKLITATSFSAANVEKGRYRGQNIPEGDLPKAVINFVGCESEYISMGPTRTIENICTWRIDVYTTSETGADSLIDEIDAVLNDRELGGATDDLMISEISYEFSTEADADYVRASLQLMTNHKTTKGD